VELLTNSMKRLNSSAVKAARNYTINAATDITGFGLAGHSAEMAEASSVTIEIALDSLLPFPDVLSLILDGVTTGGEKANRQDLTGRYELIGRAENDPLLSLLFDPQTSGGLLFSIPSEEERALLADLQDAGLDESRSIGRVLERRGENLLRIR